jgi:5'-3' exonuclease
MNFLLIDASYYVFFRFFALVNWWKFSGKADQCPDPTESPEFIEKFKEVFVAKVAEIEKKLKIKGAVKIAARDCPRPEIWRCALFPEYKGNRDKHGDFECSDFFGIAFTEKLFEKAGAHVISHPALEADDCVAITTQHILANYPEAQVYIIASDMDYLQIAGPQVHIYDLKFNDIRKSKKSTGDPLKDLFCKIVCGDKSDNIPGVFKKCGPKTAEALYEDPGELERRLSEGDARLNYERNRTLVDFQCIPAPLVESFRTEVLRPS